MNRNSRLNRRYANGFGINTGVFAAAALLVIALWAVFVGFVTAVGYGVLKLLGAF